MAGKDKQHYVDGRYTTVAEIAEEFGMKRQSLYSLMNHRQCGLQTAVNLIRENLAMNDQGRAARWMVDGKWMTVRQAADMLGINLRTMRSWIARHRHEDGTICPLAEAVHAYQEKQVIHGGSPAKQHRVNGKTMTVPEAADKLGVSLHAIYMHMSRHKASLASTIRYYEKRKLKKAEKDILAILMEGKR